MKATQGYSKYNYDSKFALQKHIVDLKYSIYHVENNMPLVTATTTTKANASARLTRRVFKKVLNEFDLLTVKQQNKVRDKSSVDAVQYLKEDSFNEALEILKIKNIQEISPINRHSKEFENIRQELKQSNSLNALHFLDCFKRACNEIVDLRVKYYYEINKLIDIWNKSCKTIIKEPYDAIFEYYNNTLLTSLKNLKQIVTHANNVYKHSFIQKTLTTSTAEEAINASNAINQEQSLAAAKIRAEIDAKYSIDKQIQWQKFQQFSYDAFKVNIKEYINRVVDLLIKSESRIVQEIVQEFNKIKRSSTYFISQISSALGTDYHHAGQMNHQILDLGRYFHSLFDFLGPDKTITALAAAEPLS